MNKNIATTIPGFITESVEKLSSYVEGSYIELFTSVEKVGCRRGRIAVLAN